MLLPRLLRLKRKVSLRTVSHVTVHLGVLYTVGFTWLAIAGVEYVPR